MNHVRIMDVRTAPSGLGRLSGIEEDLTVSGSVLGMCLGPFWERGQGDGVNMIKMYCIHA